MIEDAFRVGRIVASVASLVGGHERAERIAAAFAQEERIAILRLIEQKMVAASQSGSDDVVCSLHQLAKEIGARGTT